MAAIGLYGGHREARDAAYAKYNDRSTYDAASIIKVNLLAALLLQAQDEKRQLTRKERSHAKAMIQNSDNGSAGVLWRAIGRADGLNAANKRLGLVSTVGGHGNRWGLTQTTAKDQLALLRAVFGATETGPASASASSGGLNQASRAYIQKLMGRIAQDQIWGVSAAADSGWALKNGWLPRITTGLWDINSIGRVTADGRHYLIAVLSDGNASMSKGISLVEDAAKAAVSALQSQRPKPWSLTALEARSLSGAKDGPATAPPRPPAVRRRGRPPAVPPSPLGCRRHRTCRSEGGAPSGVEAGHALHRWSALRARRTGGTRGDRGACCGCSR
ncbi:serine hydrolase [Streptomyces himalayensis]|uniref:serine hydrolase n=1 Tax=Streptomyces himalayensis TaxID=2820085 RepID=UPI0028AB6D6F|nr:serine hydrolase [Streptomyces himalayensis]